MERLQFAMERVRIRGRQGPADNADQAVEAGRAHVQQVSPFNSHNSSVDKCRSLTIFREEEE